MINILRALRANCWLWRKRRPLSDKLQADLQNMFSAYGFRSLPRIWLMDDISQPFVWGLLRGSIYLPIDFLKVNDPQRQKSILGHELSHIIRFDAAVNFLQVVAQAVFWFHPFVWWANKKIRQEREKCCDEMAIARLNAVPEDYSTSIVEILEARKKTTRPVPSLTVAGTVKNVEERIRTMLRPGKKFYKRPSLVAATVVLLLALLTAPTALVLTARAEARAAPEREKGLARDSDVQPAERQEAEARVEKREADQREPMRQRRELQERERNIKRELEGLRDDQDEEAQELQAELREIRMKLRPIERELRGPEGERPLQPEWRGRVRRPRSERAERERELLPGRVWRREADQLQELFGRLLAYMERMERELMELREDNARLRRQLQERGRFPKERGREMRERREDSEAGEPQLRRGRREREQDKEREEREPRRERGEGERARERERAREPEEARERE